MIALQQSWPPGLAGKSRRRALLAMVLALAGLAFLDAWISQEATAWPWAWRRLFYAITDYGLSEWFLVPSASVLVTACLAMAVPRSLWRGACAEIALLAGFVFLGIGFPALLSNLAKRLIGRVRPVEFEQFGAFAFRPLFNDWTFQSFPSGHSTTAIAVAFIAGFLWPRTFRPLLAIGLAVCISRVVVGVHYPTDIAGGALVGMSGAGLVRNAFAWRGWLFERREDGRIVRKPLVALGRLVQRAWR